MNAKLRITLIILLPLVVAVGVVYLYKFESPFNCMFYQTTRLYCFGCGSGRASYELVHRNIVKAMDHNVMFVVLAPFIGYYLIKQYVYLLLGKDVLPFFPIGRVATYILLALLLGFVMIRNIPIYPFELLAP